MSIEFGRDLKKVASDGEEAVSGGASVAGGIETEGATTNRQWAGEASQAGNRGRSTSTREAKRSSYKAGS